jgi:hypothetical protein
MTPSPSRRPLLLVALLVLAVLVALFLWLRGEGCEPPQPPGPGGPDVSATPPDRSASDVSEAPAPDVPPPGPDTTAVTHPQDPVQVTVTPVLSRRTEGARRGDGHLRFFEVELRYHRPADDDPERRVGGLAVAREAVHVQPGLVDACLFDRFAVAFPPSRFPPGLDERFREDVARALGRELRAAANSARRAWWFELPRQDGERLRVQVAALCDVLGQLRESARKGLGLSDTEARDLVVTRVCPAQPLTIEPTPSMLSWHVDRLGAKASAAPPSAGGPFVDVALVDSGVAPVVPDIEHAAGPVAAGGPSGQYLAHGTAMALLLRQLLPPTLARVTSYRVFDADRVATPARVAQAIDRALSDPSRPAGRPLVVNLSLGWPPELSQPRLVTVRPLDQASPVQRCETVEGPVGEEVRYMLAAARAADSEDRPVLAVAAIGNRPGEPSAWPDLYASPDHGYGPLHQGDPCNPAVRLPWFFPAAWARVGACRLEGGALTAPVSVVVAAGATDPAADERQAVPSIPEADPPLVAPGEHVYAALYDESGAVVPIDDGPFAFPTPWSGTSVGAVLTSAAAARAQVQRRTAGLPGLRWGALERLLWLTGRDLERPSAVPGLTVRRVDVCRLREALALAAAATGGGPPAAGACNELLVCAAAAAEPPLSAELATTCSPHVAGCLGASACAVADGRPALPADALTQPTPDDDFPAGPTAPPTLCETHPCPYDRVPDAYSLGRITPQPVGDGCPDCFLKLVAAREFTLRANLNAKLPPSQWTEAWVELRGPTVISVPLRNYLGTVGFEPWKPGYSTTVGKIADTKFPATTEELQKWKAVLISTIRPDGGKEYRDESALYLESGLP